MGGTSSVEQRQPIHGGPSHEPSPPDEAQARTQRAALKDTKLKRGESRTLKAAALGMYALTRRGYLLHGTIGPAVAYFSWTSHDVLKRELT